MRRGPIMNENPPLAGLVMPAFGQRALRGSLVVSLCAGVYVSENHGGWVSAGLAVSATRSENGCSRAEWRCSGSGGVGDWGFLRQALEECTNRLGGMYCGGSGVVCALRCWRFCTKIAIECEDAVDACVGVTTWLQVMKIQILQSRFQRKSVQGLSSWKNEVDVISRRCLTCETFQGKTKNQKGALEVRERWKWD